MKENDLTAVNSAVMGQAVANNLNFDSVLGSVGFSSGRHFWEYRIQHMLDERSIYIGVTSTPGPLQSASPGVWSTQGTYGWHCSHGVLRWFDHESREVETETYGEMCDTSQVLGCLLEFEKDKGKAQLTFSVNGRSLGPAFPQMPAGRYYPLVSLASTIPGAPKNVVTLDARAPLPDCFKRHE